MEDDTKMKIFLDKASVVTEDDYGHNRFVHGEPLEALSSYKGRAGEEDDQATTDRGDNDLILDDIRADDHFLGGTSNHYGVNILLLCLPVSHGNGSCSHSGGKTAVDSQGTQ
ncbi:hypothetical protein V6N13_031231 [Hibiscus sabdariffa]|uniref:Uncharacterized protein n=1 Tax=Hibiscus sabdariffa TaxID=183260 RepID=A0ABR2CLE9_9ROSI